jgi:uncharacterized delta-60 repeat protein
MKLMVRAGLQRNLCPQKEEIVMLKTSRYLFLFILALFLSTLLACGHSSSGSSGNNKTSATVTIDVQTLPQAQSKTLQKFLGTVADITSITVDVMNGSTLLITGQHLTYSDGVWSGTLENLPIGPSLTFVGHAYNVSAVEIFKGTTVQALTGHNDSVSILMAPVDDGVPATFPRITRIIVPAQIVTSSTVTIGIWVEASSGETLTYATTAAPGGGSFSPSSGTITLGGTTGTLVLSYTAPSTAGTYTHSIRVTNSQANWVETDFSIVVSGTASAPLSVQFSPVITAIGASRSGSDVTFTAEVSDAGPLSALTYAWGFDGGLTFLNTTTNPAVLQGYDETRSGNLTLTVTNGAGGATTVSYYIAPGLLPGNLVWTGAPGTLDTAFNGQGWVTHNNAAGGDSFDEGHDITTDLSGRILVAGYSWNASGNYDMAIWRYNSNGTLDTTFNGQGWITHNNAAGGNSIDEGSAIAMDSSGRILVAGYSYNASGNPDMVIWRYNSNGTLDTTFNGQGWITHNNAAGGNGRDYGYGITIDSSGRILVAGSSYASGDYGPTYNTDMVIWRYNANGTLDTTFNGQGWVIHHNAAGGNGSDAGIGITMDSSGRILVSGSSVDVSGYYDDMVIWRYNSNGTLDTTFNGQGWVTHDNAAGGNGADCGLNVTLDSSGRILVAGISERYADAEWDMAIWRYNSNGTLDTTFNDQGWVTHHNAAGGGYEDIGYDITIDSSGRILAAGYSDRIPQADQDMTIWRYNSNGTLDLSFNGQGWVTYNGAGTESYDYGFGITIDSSGRILVAGSSHNAAWNSDMVIWRYNP